jgi:hypothetical protein
MVLLNAGADGTAGRRKAPRRREAMNRMKRASSRDGMFWYIDSSGASALQPTPLSSRGLLPLRRTGTTSTKSSPQAITNLEQYRGDHWDMSPPVLLVPVTLFFPVFERLLMIAAGSQIASPCSLQVTRTNGRMNDDVRIESRVSVWPQYQNKTAPLKRESRARACDAGRMNSLVSETSAPDGFRSALWM